MRAMLRRCGAAALLMTLGLALAGCRETTVAKILAEPNRYNDDDVGLQGRVVKSASVLGKGAYQLDDGTGTIWVVSTKGVPREGARVAVRGRVRDVVDVGTLIPLPQDIGSGLVLVESEHRAR